MEMGKGRWGSKRIGENNSQEYTTACTGVYMCMYVHVPYLNSDKDNIEQLYKEFPWKPSPLGKPPLLEWVHKVELQRILHLRNLHIFHIATASPWLLALTGDVHARCKCEVEEMATG